MKKRIFLGLGALLLIPFVAFATTDIFTASGTWVAPAGVTSVNVSAWGGGGGGGNGNSGNGRGAGGGSAYSGLTNFSVIPGNSYPVSVGPAGANPTAGGDSMFSASSTLLAKGGSSVGAAAPGGTEGQSSSGFGDIKKSGGTGGAGGSGFSGGGGGGSGGDTTDGGVGQDGNAPGTGSAGGSAGTTNGAVGGKGGTATPCVNGVVPGGGGGGGGASISFSASGCIGARGEVDITYTVAPANTKRSQMTLGQGTMTLTQGTMIIP